MISLRSLRSEARLSPGARRVRALIINSGRGQGAEMRQPARPEGSLTPETRVGAGWALPDGRWAAEGVLARLQQAQALFKGFVENGACRGGDVRVMNAHEIVHRFQAGPCKNVRDKRPTRYAPGFLVFLFFFSLFFFERTPPLNLCRCVSNSCSWMRRKAPWPFWHKLARR